MRKKLLMNKYSENGLLPVMDGLICWLDGRDGNNGDNVWKDRSVANNNVDLIHPGIFENGYLYLDGNNYGTMNNILHRSNNGIFIKFRVDSGFTDYVHILCKNLCAITLTPKNNRFRLCDVSNGDMNTPILEQGQDHIIYCGEDKLMINGVFYPKNYTFRVDPNERVQLGAYLGKQKMKGRIYSIEIYNRNLSEEEIYQIYLYEQSIKRGE